MPHCFLINKDGAYAMNMNYDRNTATKIVTVDKVLEWSTQKHEAQRLSGKPETIRLSKSLHAERVQVTATGPEPEVFMQAPAGSSRVSHY